MESCLCIIQVWLMVAYELVWLLYLHYCAWWLLKMLKCIISNKLPLFACFMNFIHDFHTWYIVYANAYFLPFITKCRSEWLRLLLFGRRFGLILSLHWVIMVQGHDLFFLDWFSLCLESLWFEDTIYSF